MIKKRRIDILGVKHKIKYPKNLKDGGYYSPSDKEIEIDLSTVANDEDYLKTLIHEGGHGVLYLTGIHQDITLPQEHAIIDSMITFLFTNFDISLKKSSR
jgi:hypothetical protein